MYQVRILYRQYSSRAEKDGVLSYTSMKITTTNQNKSLEEIKSELYKNLNRKIFTNKLSKYGMNKGVLKGFDIIENDKIVYQI